MSPKAESVSPVSGKLKLALADAAARAALRFPPLERMLVAGCRSPGLLKSLHVGAIAMGYTRVLHQTELRVADMGKYRLRVNVAEFLGASPFFFRDTCTLWFTSQLLRPGDSCVDAGANVGHYTFFMAAEVGAAGRVLSFEANPAFIEILRGTIVLNDYQSRVVLHPEALWSESGQEKTFYISTNSSNSGTSSLLKDSVFLGNGSPVTVKTITLDDAARDAGIDHFRLIKIDVERAEEFVITGAQGLLSKHRVDFLIVELFAGSKAQAQLGALGYVGWLTNWERQTLTPAGAVKSGTFGDFLFASPLQAGEVARRLCIETG